MAERTRRRASGLQSKLVSVIVVSVVFAVALVSVVMTWRDLHGEVSLETGHLVSTTGVLASLAAPALSRQDFGLAHAALNAVARTPGVTYARLETRDGRLIAETGEGVRLMRDVQLFRAGDSLSLLGLLQSRTLQVALPIESNGGAPLGRAVVLGKVSGVAGRLAISLLISLLAALVAVCAGVALAWRLQRGITQPIVSLTAAISEVRASHAFHPITGLKAKDEVGELIDGFNAMVDEVRNRDDEIARHMASLEETVERRTADLKEAKEAAEAATNAKSDFLATMSHEIRTPMTGIMVMAEMLAGGELPARQRRFADVIAKSGSSLLAIINDILDFSKIEAGKLELERAPVDLADIVEDVSALFWERARSKQLDLAAFIDPALPKLVLGDPVRLRQIVGNLTNNAIKFTERGGVLIQVEPLARGRVRISVHDTGVGIPQDKLGSVFGAFSQADQSTTRRFGGTGLGLAICERLVGAMRGSIKVASEAGRGSVFYVELPMQAIEQGEPWPLLPAAAEVALSITACSTRRVVRRYLERTGAAIRVGLDGDAPLDLLVGDPAHPRNGVAARRRICIGEYGDSAARDLQRAGLTDVVLVQPIRRRELRAMLEQVAAGEPLSDQALDEPAAAAALPNFAGARVLVADDSVVNREVGLEALSRLGVEAHAVVDGRAAVEAAGRERFQLILMDGSMPEMDGYEAARQIRQVEAGLNRPATPIVALTAHVVGTASEAWKDAGMDAVLHKPYTLAGLAGTLGRFLQATSAGEIRESAPVATTAENGQATDDDLIDPATAAELAAMAADGRQAFVAKISALYAEHAPRSIEKLQAARAADDAEAAALAAHALKSMSYNVGARKVAALALAIEQQGRGGRAPTASQARALAHALDQTLARLLAQAPVPPTAAGPGDDPLIADLALAIDRDELSLAYQPIIDRDGITLVGAEALLRWVHPSRGPISPAQFIPMAEQAGLIGPITAWVVNRMMTETADLSPLQIGVNASALEFRHKDFVQALEQAIGRHGYEARRIVVEITETAVLGNEAEIARNLDRLHDLGVSVALDDFGVGFSSLRHLRKLPFDKLKIDREFVTNCGVDPQAGAIIHGVVSVARALGMKIVAEGIETESEYRFLKVAGVHAMQGFFFAKPVPIEALRERWRGSRGDAHWRQAV